MTSWIRVLVVSLSAALAIGSASFSQPISELTRFARASMSGETDEAADLARELLTLSAEEFGLEPDEHRFLRGQFVDALVAVEDLDAAIAVYVQVLTEQEDRLGAASFELIPTLTRLADYELRNGEFDAADTYNDRAITITEDVLGADHPWLVSLLEERVQIARLRIAAQTRTVPANAPMQVRLVAAQSRQAALEETRQARRTPLVTQGAGAGDPEDENAAFDLVRVFYGTSRARTGRTDPLSFYSGRRAPADRGVETGIVTVSVPRDRELGAIPKRNIWRGEFRPDPAKHVIVEDIEAFPGLAEFAAELRRTIDRSRRREALIFIHGFSNDFADAAERTAQLAVDLELDGAPIMYSWPSRGGMLDYFVDSSTVVRPVIDDLEQFLTLVAQESGAERLHLVAHSMGNQYLIEALEEIAEDQPNGASPLFNEIVFAAPDVAADDFAARLPDVRPLADRMTLYASDRDRALQLSHIVNGYRRAGDASELLVLAGLETVDTSPSPRPRGLVRHNDVFEQALDDFRSIIWYSLAPEARCLLDDVAVADGVAWSYSVPEPETCDTDVFTAAIVTLRRLGGERTLQLLDNQIELTTAAGDLDSATRWSAVREIVRGIEAAR